MLSRAGVPRHAIIKKFAGEEITELDKFISVLSKLSRGTRVPLEYITYTDRYRSKVFLISYFCILHTTFNILVFYISFFFEIFFMLSLQSVLVTIECHEWYAPPQIYTRDDSTGLWTARPAILHGSPLLSPIVDSAGNGMSYQATTIDSIHQHNDKDWRDGCTGMQTNEETVVEELHIQVGSNVETKRRRVEEDLAAEGIVMSDAIIHEPREETMEDSRILEHTDLLGDRGSAAVATNASVAEQVIEPTLVMFEVGNISMFKYGQASILSFS